MPVFWAAVLATVFFPLHRRYVARLRGRKSLAALATMLTIVGVVVATLIRVLPLGDARVSQLLAKFSDVAIAMIKGTLVVGIVQGAIGGVLFWTLGIPAPVFWGTVMAMFSVLPAVGPGLVWAPAAIILFGLGEIVKGIVVIIVGVIVIGLVDNVLRPILVGRDTEMPDYLVLLATLGGLSVFGVSGFVIGPVIAAFFLVGGGMLAQE